MTASPELFAEPASEQVPTDLVEAGAYPTVEAGFDHGLVVLAMGQPYWLVPHDGSFCLLVEPHALIDAREQLARFDRESIGWPPRPIKKNLPARKTELLTPMLWCLLLLAVFWLQGEWPGWTDAGAIDAQAVFNRGEWWRLGTALFLHADTAHVVANTLSGLLVFSAVLSTMGRLRGWLLLALASVAGNLAVTALHYPGSYRSLGASTAVFAGLGLLTGRAVGVVRQAERQCRWRAMFAPFGAGLTVLALYGAGGMNIDVAAHITGFAAGIILGFIAAMSRRAEAGQGESPVAKRGRV